MVTVEWSESLGKKGGDDSSCNAYSVDEQQKGRGFLAGNSYDVSTKGTELFEVSIFFFRLLMFNFCKMMLLLPRLVEGTTLLNPRLYESIINLPRSFASPL